MLSTATPPLRAATLPPLASWLQANRAQMPNVELQYDEEVGAGLVATQDVPPGTISCVVPSSMLLTAKSGLDDPAIGAILSDLQEEIEEEANLFDASQALIAMQVLAAATRVRQGGSCHWEPYIRCLPDAILTPVLWPRALRNSCLAGTALRDDALELRGDLAREYRRVRRALRRRARTHPGEDGTAIFGLDPSEPCPLSGRPGRSGFERWALAQSLVRSRAYVVVDEPALGQGDLTAEALLGGFGRPNELVMSPLIDLANHDDALSGGVEWGDGTPMAPRDSLVLRTERAVVAGSPLLCSYGTHSRCGSLLAFGFSTEAQRCTTTCRLAASPTDPHAAAKAATLTAAGIGRGGVASFEVPSAPPEVSGELLQALRLLALPPADATALLSAAREATEAEHQGFGSRPMVTEDGVDIWALLGSEVAPARIERAAYAFLLRTCRAQARALRQAEPLAAAAGPSAPRALAVAAATGTSRKGRNKKRSSAGAGRG